MSDMLDSIAFGKIYVASKPRAQRALYAGMFGELNGRMLDIGARENLCTNLALSGLIIDPVIDASAGDPLGTMRNRQMRGLTRVPSLLQKLPKVWLDPGVHSPGIPDYDPSQWDIKVSTDPADYPSFVDPTPETDYVGLYAGGNLYNTINSPEKVFEVGKVINKGGINYELMHVIAEPFYYWKYLGRN